MSDLVAFLNARLDEDEAVANEVQGVLDGGWNYFDEIPTKLIDPARALREVEAKRRIIRLMGTSGKYGPVEWDEGDEVLLALAAVWSDHPGYDSAWA